MWQASSAAARTGLSLTALASSAAGGRTRLSLTVATRLQRRCGGRRRSCSAAASTKRSKVATSGSFHAFRAMPAKKSGSLPAAPQASAPSSTSRGKPRSARGTIRASSSAALAASSAALAASSAAFASSICLCSSRSLAPLSSCSSTSASSWCTTTTLAATRARNSREVGAFAGILRSASTRKPSRCSWMRRKTSPSATWNLRPRGGATPSSSSSSFLGMSSLRKSIVSERAS
mmetsp:Transcript_40660/g.127222  ORF Transcript_40660/g.127222 Transcript_40660/m.127222 type:complete len:233 (-) Transcript_40660:1884-2582(-)